MYLFLSIHFDEFWPMHVPLFDFHHDQDRVFPLHHIPIPSALPTPTSATVIQAFCHYGLLLSFVDKALYKWNHKIFILFWCLASLSILSETQVCCPVSQ